MDLTPIVPAGRQLIERYGPSGFRISGVIWRGPVLVFPEATMLWAARDVAAVDWESLSPVVGRGGVQILLLGLGTASVTIGGKLRARLREAGIALEAMDTSAACRTYNVLVAEDRQVAAALMPPL
ncbi:MAG TPA: Mth938-like domain-containing protein [Stellaceae bacterium]|nr:Mth938-like domain-containing protein [Stellaceae bacterium]